MRIDLVSIFPRFFDNLELSLVGRARESGVLDLRVHDLRDHTHDRHRTVDDTPYGGGAGMVMKPEPWGEALDSIIASAALRPTVVVPTPSGAPFDQAAARDLAGRPHLVFAAGRYEGIDQRVVDHYRARTDVAGVLELSIGDYVLNGGEAAVVVMVEAAVRLRPGFMGNPDSLAEESHGGGGLLEYPVYTKPREWRGLDVPDQLVSGHHAAIADWRTDQARRRTAERRPDLWHASQAVTLDDLPDLDVRLATPGDAAELYVLQRCCWVSEARANDMLDVPPLTESLEDLRASLAQWRTFVVRAGGRLVGSVRGRSRGDAWEVGRLMVAPDLTGRGLGRWLLAYAEQAAPVDVQRFELVTGARSASNLRMYRKAGYRLGARDDPAPGVVRLLKRRH